MKVVSFLLLVACVACQTAPSPSNNTDPTFGSDDDALLAKRATRIFILRHAEKADHEAWNTELKSPEGFERARAWVSILSPKAPAALYVSNLQRTQQTLQPTSEALTLTPNIRPAVAASEDRPSVEDTTALAAEILADHRNETVVVCWHTPYVIDLAVALGVPKADVPDWDHSTYDHLWTVTVRKNGRASLVDTAF